MAKKQTRRSISVSKTTYDRLQVYCTENSLSLSGFVEARIAEALGYASPPIRKVAKTSRWPVDPQPIDSSGNLPTAAEIKKSLDAPPPPIVKKPEVKVEPKSSLPPSKIFTF